MMGYNAGFFALLALGLVAGVTDAQQFFGGSTAHPGEVPYQISLRYNGRHHCGGAIISHRHILTAASCVKDVPDFNNAVIVTGSVNVNEGQTHKIKAVFYHPDWNQYISGLPNDVAIIVLYGDIIFNHYQNKINLPVAPTPSHAVAIVSGWGATQNNPYGYFSNLNKAQVYTLGANECQTVLGQSGKIWQYQICTYSSAGVSICLGDGGGPLAYNGQLIGIVSWGYHCSLGYPDVYTSVYHYLNWITPYLTNTT